VTESSPLLGGESAGSFAGPRRGRTELRRRTGQAVDALGPAHGTGRIRHLDTVSGCTRNSPAMSLLLLPSAHAILERIASTCADVERRAHVHREWHGDSPAVSCDLAQQHIKERP
jgi:hypothetical protein